MLKWLEVLLGASLFKKKELYTLYHVSVLGCSHVSVTICKWKQVLTVFNLTTKYNMQFLLDHTAIYKRIETQDFTYTKGWEHPQAKISLWPNRSIHGKRKKMAYLQVIPGSQLPAIATSVTCDETAR